MDWVGHSMGGVLLRVYACGMEGWQPRAQNHSNIEIVRDEETDDYLNAQNWFAGPIRRFITIGTPFDGSALANLGEGVVKAKALPSSTQRFVKRAGSIARRFAQHMENDGQVGIFPAEVTLTWDQTLERLTDELNAAAFDWTTFPDALIDLQPNSVFQQILEHPTASYPTGNRRVLWHPIIGIAHHQVQPDEWREFIWDGLFNGLAGVADGLWSGAGAGVNTANATAGDIVVLRESQANGQPESQGSPFILTIHSGPVIVTLGIRPETNHADIADRVRELLSRPATGSPWQGDISQ